MLRFAIPLETAERIGAVEAASSLPSPPVTVGYPYLGQGGEVPQRIFISFASNTIQELSSGVFRGCRMSISHGRPTLVTHFHNGDAIKD